MDLYYIDSKGPEPKLVPFSSLENGDFFIFTANLVGHPTYSKSFLCQKLLVAVSGSTKLVTRVRSFSSNTIENIVYRFPDLNIIPSDNELVQKIFIDSITFLKA